MSLSKNKVLNEIKIRSGFWRSAGYNPFWINVVGGNVFWLGMNQQKDGIKSGEEWCHVGFGKIQGNKIKLDWSDIPIGKDQLHGKIIIEIIDEIHIKVIEDSGNFGKSEWKWVEEGKHFTGL